MKDLTAKRSPLALAVLVLLHEQPMHVYRMRQVIRQRGEDVFVNIAQANSLYQTVQRLERVGLIAATSGSDESEADAKRTVYMLSESGKAAMLAWTRQMLAVPAREYPEFPVAISVLAVLSPKDAQKRLQQRQDLLAREIQEIRSRLKAFEWLPRLFRLEQECMLATKEAEASWVETILGELRTGRLIWSASSIDRDLKSLQGSDTLPISPDLPKRRTRR